MRSRPSTSATWLHDDGRIRRRIALRTFKRSSSEAATQEVFIPDSLWYKLGKLVS
jgi:hypothetical protein